MILLKGTPLFCNKYLGWSFVDLKLPLALYQGRGNGRQQVKSLLIKEYNVVIIFLYARPIDVPFQ